jgi:hypothetical protein
MTEGVRNTESERDIRRDQCEESATLDGPTGTDTAMDSAHLLVEPTSAGTVGGSSHDGASKDAGSTGPLQFFMPIPG